MPGKSTKEGKTPKPRKRNSSNSSSSAEQPSNHVADDPGSIPPQHPNAVPRYPDPNAPSSYCPPYRDDGQGQGYPSQNYYPQQPHMPGLPGMPGSMPPGHSNGMGMNMGGGAPAQGTTFAYPPQPSPSRIPSGVVENGHSSHSSPSPSQSPQIAPSPQDREHCSKILDQNAQVILQINQAIMENRADVINELMPLLSKNIQYLSSLAEQQPSPTHHPAMPPPDPHHRVSQSPLPVRPVSQGTPPHISPPPGTPQMTVQNGTAYPTHAAYAPYGQTQQPRPQPVYSPLAQSTGGVQPRSPNMTFQNGPNRPAMYPQQMQQQYPTGMNTGQSSSAMPPPMSYPYPPQSRAGSMPNYAGANNYVPQEQGDPNFSSMPPPQMQPKRSTSTPYRPAMPQNTVPDQRQMSYQPRPYSNAYAQDPSSQQSMHYPNQQQQMAGPSQQQQQMYPPQHSHQQQHQQHQQQQAMMASMASSSSYPPSIPSNQYSMSQTPHGQFRSPDGQFRTPAVPPPSSPYGMPSPSGSTSSG